MLILTQMIIMIALSKTNDWSKKIANKLAK